MQKDFDIKNMIMTIKTLEWDVKKLKEILKE